MSALLFIRERRRNLEKIELVGLIRLAAKGSNRDVEKRMERWARDAEVQLTFEE
jgi:hypothetical protein